MTLSGTQVRYEMVATGDPSSVHISGAAVIGTAISTVVYTTAPTVAYSLGMVIYDGDTLTLDTTTGAVTGTVAGQNQVETATGVGTVTVAGNAEVIVTAALLDVSPVTFSIPVSTGAPSVWMAEIRAYLAAQTSITEHYAVGGASATASLTTLEKLPNDGTLNIDISTGTATGITAAPSSANTTAGIGNSRAYRINGQAWDETDFEGRPLPAMTNIGSTLIKTESTNTTFVNVSGGGYDVNLLPGSGDLCFSPSCQHPASGSSLAFAASGGDVSLTIDIQAV